MKNGQVQLLGEIIEILSSNTIIVLLENKNKVEAKKSDKLGLVRLVTGDKVLVGLSPGNITEGIIIQKF